MGSSSNTVAVHSLQDIEATLSRYSPALYRVALRQLRNHEDAEDAVQDALLSAFIHISQFEGRSHISTWLHRIVVNSARMHLRRQHGHTVLSLDQTDENENQAFENQLVDSEPNPERVCEQSEIRGIIQQVLELLSPRLRDALQLRDLDSLSTQEAAQVLGITKGALKCRVQRARAKLTLLLPSGV